MPLLLHTYVVDATTCRPIRNAAVDIWHADAGGVYSGFGAGASSRTFMRGVQRTNAKSRAVFRRVYRAPYNARPNRDTRNATDAIYRNGGKSLLSVRKSSGGLYIATSTMGIQRS